MTSREIIMRNITHNDPERPGLTFNRRRLNDIRGAGVGPSAHWQEKRWVEGDVEYYTDEWGNIWHRFVYGSKGGEIYRPAIEDWAQLKDLRVPDFDNPVRFERMRNAFAAEESRFKLASIPGWVFATSRYLRKMEVYFMDLLLERDHIEELHDIVTGLYERVIIQCAKAGADAVFFCEDLGTQERVLIGPAMWRDIFAPHYRRLCGTAHAHGLKVIMHSCGYNWELLDDLMDSGIDCFQFDQPAAYDQEALSAKLRERKVGLWAPVDIQQIMPTGDKKLIKDEARRMVETYKGGLIMKNYGDLAGIGVKEEWDDWAYEAILEAIGM
ncbi:MAG: uroporphyrinogen decarboxylase family protein [Limnochordia bacterium]|jgi:uroporphyrinogen decarboxylase